MIVHNVISRLRSIDSPVFNDRVAGSIDYFTAQSGNNLKAPYIYVIEGDQQLEGNVQEFGDDSLLEADWRTTFLVIAVCKPPRADEDMSMKWAADVVQPIRDIIWGALLNWCPSDCYTPITPVSVVAGEAGKSEDGEYLQIVFTFRTTETIEFEDYGDTPTCIGKLNKFGIAMNGVSALIDPCEEKPDCEIP